MVDLHTHSYYSDGTCAPAWLVQQARKLGLSAVALCDHNTVAGLPEFLEAGQQYAVQTVPGIEFSTQHRGVELHVLALFVEPTHYASIDALLEDFRRRKEQNNVQLVKALGQAGIPIDYDKLRGQTQGYVNRAVIGGELTAMGYTASVQEAFRKYLTPEQGYYVPPERLDTLDTVGFIKSLGAVAVLAHPFVNLTARQLRSFLPEALKRGLDAMEIRYPEYDLRTTRLAGRIAGEFQLLPSGGSDFHGSNKPDIHLGMGRGTLQVPDAFLQQLKARKDQGKL